MAQIITQRQADSKSRQGVFFMTLAAGATFTVLLMLFALLAYMLFHGASRLFYSPVFEVKFVDGTVQRTGLNEELEFDVIGPDGRAEARGASQAAKYLTQLKAEASKYSQAELPPGTRVEVYEDVVSEVDDPFAEGPSTVKVKRTEPVLRESLAGVKEARFNAEAQLYTLVMKDGTTRELGGKQHLSFKQGAELMNWETLVTRYLREHPEVSAQRLKTVSFAELAADAPRAVDPRWPAFLVVHEQGQSKRGTAFPPVASFRQLDTWNWFQFFWDSPRASNTAGGVFPCIFGTVLLTLIMTLIVAPFGLATAVYLKEYARDNWFTQAIRMAVSNLAGVPSIIFGLFGLGFFVMTVGGGIDRTFYGGDKVFGTPCVLWASLTMALLTLPVMIVTCEEALRTVPKELREGAMALGATRFSTLLTVVIPASLPGILTGLILAIARASGEVAPLLLTGVVAQKDKLPFSPLEKFMSLAYHVYDLSVKSPPNKIEEAQALAFSAALVLLVVVLAMNLSALWIRARLSKIKMS